MKKRILLITLFFIISILPFYRYLLFGEIPFNGNYLVSEYSPFREETKKQFPNGLPSKPNFDDQLRQYFPYLEFTRKSFLKGEFPAWNPYNFSGVPFAANWQTAVYFPTNILLFFVDTADYWAITRILPFFLCLCFTYLYLRSLKLSMLTGIFGAVLYTFSGTFISYSQETIYNNFIMAFLPAVLFGIEIYHVEHSNKFLLFVLALLILTWLSGHIQQSFYLFLFCFIYSCWIPDKKSDNLAKVKIAGIFLLSIISTLFFLYPGFRFYQESTRSAVDFTMKIKEYLLPSYTMFTYLAPDYLGNPGTRNWFGFSIGAYHEKALWISSLFVGFFIYSLLNYKKHTKIKKFYFFAFILILILVFRNIFSYFFVDLKIPVLGTAIFNRLIFLNTFFLVIITAFGFEELREHRNEKLKVFFKIATLSILIFLSAWIYARFTINFDFGSPNIDLHRAIAIKNMIFPGVILSISLILTALFFVTKKKIFLLIIIIASLMQGYYEFNKYVPFSKRETFYPSHPLIEFLKEHAAKENSRVYFVNKEMEWVFDDLATYYEIPTISGYDPINYKKYNDMLFYLEHPRTEINNRRYDAMMDSLIKNFDKKTVVLKKLKVNYLVSKKGDLEESTDKFKRTFKKIYNYDVFTVWTWK